ncbi:MAG: UDP-glucose 4-epimerase GalE [Candidatus Aminicenantes bacterium]|nr:UDP-glucose 4-epimerase GalE [Candidatus Aminicenantes bacterium]
MKILVTGGAGYIGSHTVKELLKKKHEVTIFDNFSSGKKELVLKGELFTGDLMDKKAVEKVFSQKKFDAVCHFASLIAVGESYQDPGKYYSHNLISSLNLLESMRQHGVKRFVFSSSAAVYGIPREIPITESHPLDPFNPYGKSKAFVERILEDYERAYGFRFVSLRYFNAAGADPDGRLGELHDPETHLIPNILLFLLGKKNSFYVFGTDFPTDDGTAVRDYIHVKDLARAHVLALKKLEDDTESAFINLGTNRGLSVLEIIRKVEEITGRKVRYIKKPVRKGDVPVLRASRDKAERFLGWKPAFSDIKTIIQTAWDWHSKHP